MASIPARAHQRVELGHDERTGWAVGQDLAERGVLHGLMVGLVVGCRPPTFRE